MNRTCTVWQQGLTVGDREDRGEPFVHRASIAHCFHPGAPRSAPRSFTVLPCGPTVSIRFNTVHPGRAPLPGPPRFTTVVFDMSKTTGKTPGSSRSIRHHPGPSRWHYGSTPGTPRFTPVHGPGWTGEYREPSGTGALQKLLSNTTLSHVIWHVGELSISGFAGPRHGWE